MLEGWLQDFRFAARTLAQRPGFTLIAVFTLALGIGVNTAIYSVVDAVLVRPLPFQDSDRMAVIWETNPELGIPRAGPSGPIFMDWREQARSFEDLVLLQPGTGTLNGFGEPEQIPAMRVSANYFDFFGIQPEKGRFFKSEDGQGAFNPIVVLSYSYWMRSSGGDESILNTQFSGDGLSYTLIGVTPKDLWTPLPADALVPWPWEFLRHDGRDDREFGVIGRLRPGVTAAQAQAELDAISRGLETDYPEAMRGWKTTVVPLRDAFFSSFRPALLALLAAVACVLLIACANVANLLLARSTGRHRGLTIRGALGAGRWRLARQLLCEGLTLGLAGGGVGVLTGYWGLEALQALLPQRISIPNGNAEILLPRIAIDTRILLFTLAATLLTTLLFTLVPAWQAARANPQEALMRATRGQATRGQRRLREILVAAEVALAFVLLTGAGLMIQSFQSLRHVDPGLEADHVLTMEIELPTDSRYQTRPEQAAFFEEVVTRVAALPQVESAGAIEGLPLSDNLETRTFRLPDRARETNQLYAAQYRRITDGYFETLRIPLREGRVFDLKDTSESSPVAMVDETFSHRFWPDGGAVGSYLTIEDGISAPRRIVGIVGAVRQSGLDDTPQPTLYVPHRQRPTALMALAVRSSAEPAALTRVLKETVWSVDPLQPVYRIRTMEEIVGGSMATHRGTFWLLGAFALAALALASIGIYGVLSYTVAQRVPELGVRMALGADPRRLVRLVAARGMLPVALGLALGAGCALAFSQLLSSMLVGLGPRDPLTFALTAITLGAVALAACYLPAARASRIDPVTALAAE